MLARPTSSTLFPYTTLFRSNSRWSRKRRRSPYPRTARRNPSPTDPPASQGRPSGKRPRKSKPAGLLRLRSEEHTSELQSHSDLVCRLLLEKNKPPTSLLPRSVRNARHLDSSLLEC